MVKIKQKKTMNLPQLIEHIEQTDYEACVYQADDAPVYVRVGRIKGINIEGSGTVFPHNTFTVEVEKVVTEDTIFKELICLDVDSEYDNYDNVSVSDFVIGAIKAIYIPNDDLTMSLIWRDGKLVE